MQPPPADGPLRDRGPGPRGKPGGAGGPERALDRLGACTPPGEGNCAGHGLQRQPDLWRAGGQCLQRSLRLHLLSSAVRVQLVLQLHLYCRYGPLLGESGRGGASMSVAVWSGSLVAWERELAALKARIGPVFGRAEVRETAGAFSTACCPGSGAKQAGFWPSRRVWSGPIACSRSWGAAAG